MQFLLFSIFAALIVVADQITKYLTVAWIPLYGQKDFIPGLLSLTYAQNTGAAWSAMEGMIWLFVLIFLIFVAGMIWEFITNKLGFTTFERWCVMAVFGGGLGNMIDRLRLGYVVDMIRLEFMNFPIFNVADCFITCGCILLMVHLLFFNENFRKEKE
jgi:signal peptidase II